MYNWPNLLKYCGGSILDNIFFKKILRCRQLGLTHAYLICNLGYEPMVTP
jgi:hypothetical protein